MCYTVYIDIRGWVGKNNAKDDNDAFWNMRTLCWIHHLNFYLKDLWKWFSIALALKIAFKECLDLTQQRYGIRFVSMSQSHKQNFINIKQN